MGTITDLLIEERARYTTVALGLVIARFHEEIANEIQDEAKARVTAYDAELVKTVSVPGVCDVPPCR